MNDPKVTVENVNVPGHVTRVDRAKYEAMRDAYLTVLPSEPPGMTAADIKAALLPLLPEALFPKGATSGWWMKTVQLDLEAKGSVDRSQTKPLRFHKALKGK